jgi:hypothetical protein
MNPPVFIMIMIGGEEKKAEFDGLQIADWRLQI